MSAPTVFVTVGTDHHPFDRLVSWADEAHAQTEMPRFFLQTGTSRSPTQAPFAEYLAFSELTDRIRASSAVVTHGGPATIIQVRREGLLPIVVPRRRANNEHVDDHQWRFALRLAESGDVLLVEDHPSFVAAMKQVMVDPAAFALSEASNHSVDTTVTNFARLIESATLNKRSRG